MKKSRVFVLTLIVGLSMLLSACAATQAAEEAIYDIMPEAPAMGGDFDNAQPEMEASTAEERGFDTGSSNGTNAVDRMVIYNADLRIAVLDPQSAMESVIRMAENAGGFVVQSNLYQTYTENGSLPRATLTVRVPAGQLDSIMESIKNLTPDPKEDVISENVSGQDVTAEYTDLESRLRNLEAAEQALVELMAEARDPEDVLAIFDELVYYRGEIELVKGRMRYLEESADLSAISVDIVAKESLQPIEIAGWEPQGTAKRAIESLIRTAQSLADAGIWFGIYCLPFLIPLGIGVYFLVRLLRKRRKNKKAKKTEVIEKSEPASE